MNHMQTILRYLLVVIGLGVGSVQAQPSVRDSLQHRLEEISGEGGPSTLCRLAEGYLRDSLDLSIAYSQQALSLATQLSQPASQAQAYDLMGRAYMLKGNQFLAAECLEKGVQLARKLDQPGQLAHLLNTLGILHARQGKFETALDLLAEARPIWEKLGDQLRASYLLINLGSLQMELQHYDQAINNFEEALEQAARLDNARLKSFAINNLGSAYEKLKRYDRALDYYEQALALKDQLPNSGSAESSTLGNIHSVLIEQGKEAEAEKIYLRALKLVQQSGNQNTLQSLLKQRGDAMLKLGKHREARDLLQQSLGLAQGANFLPEQAYLYEQLAKNAAAMGQHAEAYAHQIQASNTRQRIYDKESADRMAEMQARYQLTEMEKQVATLQAVQRTKELQLLALLAVVALFVVALLALYGRYLHRRRTQALVEQRNEEIEKQNHLLGVKNREIKQQYERLEEQGHAIQVQNQQLLQSNEELGQLAYAASHDLREPLRTITSYLQLIERRNGHQLDEGGKEFLQYATQGARRLQELLSDLLEYSHVGRANPQPTKVYLEKLIQEVVDQLNSRISEAGATVHWDNLPAIQGYPSELYLLFQNLVGNAIKFKRTDIQPEVVIEARQEGNYHLISVKDNGIGIEMQHRERVFQMFQRLHQREDYEGTGVGLTLCQKVVRNHGGHIWFDSVPGEGTIFWIKLPSRLPQSLSMQ